MADRDIPQIGVDIYTPDFQTIARGFGCRALRAESLAHLRDALREAVDGRPADGDRDRRRGRAGVDMSTQALTERPASLFVNGAFRPASGGDRLSVVDPSTGAALRRDRLRRRGGRRGGGGRRDGRLPVLGTARRRRSGRSSCAASREGLRAPGGRPRAAADAEQRQAAGRGRDRRRRRRRHLRLLRQPRRRARRPPGRAGADARRRLRRQDPLRAGRPGRHDRALELPAGHQRLEDRAGAGRRLHRGAQDLRVHPAGRARLRRHRPGGRAARRRAQPDHRRRRGRRRADPRPAAAQALLHRLEPGRVQGDGARPPRAACRSRWSSAENRRSSSSPTPISTTPSTASPAASSSTPARCARRPRG